MDGNSENFKRVLEPNVSKTYNDFFGREHTVQQLEQFNKLSTQWTRSIGDTSLFDDSYIPTIHVTGKKAEKFFKNPTAGKGFLEQINFYLKDETYIVKVSLMIIKYNCISNIIIKNRLINVISKLIYIYKLEC